VHLHRLTCSGGSRQELRGRRGKVSIGSRTPTPSIGINSAGASAVAWHVGVVDHFVGRFPVSIGSIGFRGQALNLATAADSSLDELAIDGVSIVGIEMLCTRPSACPEINQGVHPRVGHGLGGGRWLAVIASRIRG
jgi:hypothetical protein